MKKNQVSFLKKLGGIVSTAGGSAIGSLGGIGGAAAGTAIGEVLKTVLEDIADRYLSPREEERISNVALLAIEKIQEQRLWNSIRDDDFFEPDDGSPSASEEIFEGVLLSAKQEHEQMKLPYLASFFANLAFDSTIKRSEANYLLSIAESLTYTQLCLLGLKSENQKEKYDLRSQSRNATAQENLYISEQANHLDQRRLFKKRSPFAADVSIGGSEASPCDVSLSEVGQRLSDLMELHMIDKIDLERTARSW